MVFISLCVNFRSKWKSSLSMKLKYKNKLLEYVHLVIHAVHDRGWNL